MTPDQADRPARADPPAVAAVVFMSFGAWALIAGAWLCWSAGVALIVAGALGIAIGVDLARPPRTRRPGPAIRPTTPMRRDGMDVTP